MIIMSNGVDSLISNVEHVFQYCSGLCIVVTMICCLCPSMDTVVAVLTTYVLAVTSHSATMV